MTVTPQDYTPIAKYRVPNDDQPPDGPVQLGQLAMDFQPTTSLKYSNASARDAAIPFPGEGQKVYLTTTGEHQVYDSVGKKWLTINTGTIPALVWTALPLRSNWSPYNAVYGGNWQVPQYTKDAFGIVRLRGLAVCTLNNGGGEVALLPAGYRPVYNRGFMTGDGPSRFDRLDIYPSGLVVLGVPNGVPKDYFVFMDAVAFPPT